MCAEVKLGEFIAKMDNPTKVNLSGGYFVGINTRDGLLV